MVTHIVMWTLKESEKASAGAQMKSRLEALVGQVPGLQDAQVHLGFAGSDVCLISHHDSREALDVYQNHPAHLAVKAYIHTVIDGRASCDFES